MKVNMFLALVMAVIGVAGCSTNKSVLTTSGKVYERTMDNIPFVCFKVNEWDVDPADPAQNVGCWCLSPIFATPSESAARMFLMMKDIVCTDEFPQ